VLSSSLKKGSKQGDDAYYSFYDNSFIKGYRITKIPLSVRDTTKRSALSYSPVGIGNFHPWFVSNNNPAAMEEYFNVVMDILKVTDQAIEKEEYWFFRADVNVVMAWLRVPSYVGLSLLIFCCRWCGLKNVSSDHGLEWHVQLSNFSTLTRNYSRMSGRNLNSSTPFSRP